MEEETWKTSKVGEVEVPSTDKVAAGVVEPMPTVWEEVTVRMEIPVEEVILRRLLVEPAIPCKDSREPGVVELMPTFPLLRTLNSWALLEEATAKTAMVGKVEVPCTTKVALGVVEPIPTLWLAVTLRTEMPVEEAMFKISLEPELPCRVKVMEEVALTPKTEPLLNKVLVDRAVAEVKYGT